MNLDFFVAQRFSAQQPPTWLKSAVSAGELPVESIDVWTGISRELGRNFDMSSAVSYWENEMRLRGLSFPQNLVPPLNSEVGSDETVGEWRLQFVNSEMMLKHLESRASQLGLDPIESILHRDHHNPTVEFEKNYQFHLILIRKLLAGNFDESSTKERLEVLLRKLNKLLTQAGS